MRDLDAFAKELAGLGFNDDEMRHKLLKEGADDASASALVRKHSSRSLFRASNLWKALSVVALVITLVAIVLLPAAGGRAASLGVIGSLTGGLVMFAAFRRGGDRPWMGMMAVVLGLFVLVSSLAIDFEENVVGFAGDSPSCDEVGGYCAESCVEINDPSGWCAEGFSCCAEE